MKEFWESVNILRSYRRELVVYCIGTPCIYSLFCATLIFADTVCRKKRKKAECWTHDSKLDEAEEAETVWAHLTDRQDERRTTCEESNVVGMVEGDWCCGRTARRWSDEIMDWFRGSPTALDKSLALIDHVITSFN